MILSTYIFGISFMIKVWVILMFSIGTLGKIKKECENMYSRYCKLMTPDKCYFSYNRLLCCATCEHFQSQYSLSALEGGYCAYGNRRAGCATMSSNLCYNIYNRYICCATCARARTNMKHCLYGDRDVFYCNRIKSNHCYKKSVQKECCKTCNKYYTKQKGCEYGDGLQLFHHKDKLYNCRAYVAHFGSSRCFLPWDKDFQKACCYSCNSRNRKSNYSYH